MNTLPLISIVIPCYRGEAFVAEAIESCLDQSYRNLEVIVVDDASPDTCADIAEAFAAHDDRVRVIRKPQNGGVAKAFNAGFAVSHGEYMTRLAQDDCFRSDAIDIMARCLNCRPDVGLVCCDMQIMNAAREIIGLRKVSASAQGIAEGRIGLCLMWRRRAWDAVGGFDPVFDAAEDYEFVLRVSREYSACKAGDEAPFFLRLHDEMGSRRFQLVQELAIHKARARHCDNYLTARKHLSDGFWEASYIQRSQRRFGSALQYGACAIAYWPFRLRNYRSILGIGRDAWLARQK